MKMKCWINLKQIVNNGVKVVVSGGALLLMVVSGVAGAEIYKWTDKQGVQHYSEQPPPGEQYERVKPNYAPASPPAVTEPQNTPPAGQKVVDTDRARQELAHKEEAAKIKRQNCTTVQQRLTDLGAARRINFQDAEGNVKLLTEDERLAKVEETKALIDEYCQ